MMLPDNYVWIVYEVNQETGSRQILVWTMSLTAGKCYTRAQTKNNLEWTDHQDRSVGLPNSPLSKYFVVQRVKYAGT